MTQVLPILISPTLFKHINTSHIYSEHGELSVEVKDTGKQRYLSVWTFTSRIQWNTHNPLVLKWSSSSFHWFVLYWIFIFLVILCNSRVMWKIRDKYQRINPKWAYIRDLLNKLSSPPHRAGLSTPYESPLLN